MEATKIYECSKRASQILAMQSMMELANPGKEAKALLLNGNSLYLV
jgi:hypothetical protein